jgi:phage baseplate assembly protein gpV
MLRLAVVTDNQDPDGLRRVRVSSADRGVSQSDWLSRITGFCDQDLPVPPLGATVVIAQMEGGSTDELVLGVLQTTTSNAPLLKEKLSDRVERVYGNQVLDLIGYSFQRASRFWSWFTNDQSSVTIGSNGVILQKGNTILRVEDGLVEVSANMFKWNGERVAVVGGTDSDGDTTLR